MRFLVLVFLCFLFNNCASASSSSSQTNIDPYRPIYLQPQQQHLEQLLQLKQLHRQQLQHLQRLQQQQRQQPHLQLLQQVHLQELQQEELLLQLQLHQLQQQHPQQLHPQHLEQLQQLLQQLQHLQLEIQLQLQRPQPEFVYYEKAIKKCVLKSYKTALGFHHMCRELNPHGMENHIATMKQATILCVKAVGRGFSCFADLLVDQGQPGFETKSFYPRDHPISRLIRN